MDSKTFYDRYADRQLAAGVNKRHHSILGLLRSRGMKRGDRVLEIGTGVGTLTGLIAAELDGDGSIVGVDLSPRSIGIARERLARFKGVQLLASDVLEAEVSGTFNVVVLPDVIEHIPLESHRALFQKIAEWLDPTGFVLLHFPNPFFLEWCRLHRPDLLQQIDQPIHLDLLAANVYAAGLWIETLKTYSIWVTEGDYQAAVLRPRPEKPDFTLVAEKPSLVERVKGRIKRLLK